MDELDREEPREAEGRPGFSMALETILVALSLYAMLVVPGLTSFAAGFLGFSAVVVRRSLRRAAQRKRLTSGVSDIEAALDLLDATRDWKFDVLEFGVTAIVLSTAIPTAFRAVAQGLPAGGTLLGIGIAASVPALFLSGREAFARLTGQIRARRILGRADREVGEIEAG